MDKNKLKYLNLLEKDIKIVEEFRGNLQEYLNVIKEEEIQPALYFTTLNDVKVPYISNPEFKSVFKECELEFSAEIKILCILMLEKLDTKLSELREEFENN
jgi:hypothetical protein